MEDCLDFIRREDEVCRGLDGEEVGAFLPEGGGLGFGCLVDCCHRRAHRPAHRAVVLSVAAAAGGEVRLRGGRGEERRDDGKDEEQQQRDGEKAAHSAVRNCLKERGRGLMVTTSGEAPFVQLYSESNGGPDASAGHEAW